MTRNLYDWLEGADDEALRKLRDYVTAANGAWKTVDSLSEAQRLLESDTSVGEAERRALHMELGQAFLLFERKVRRPSWTLLAFGPSIFFLMMSVLGIIAFGVFWGSEQSLLIQLSNENTARGLITFIFALGVMSLALIIVSANFISSTVTPAAFDRAKEVFTSLVAILGTILGFYFGVGLEPTDQSAAGAEQQAATATGSQDTE